MSWFMIVPLILVATMVNGQPFDAVRLEPEFQEGPSQQLIFARELVREAVNCKSCSEYERYYSIGRAAVNARAVVLKWPSVSWAVEEALSMEADLYAQVEMWPTALRAADNLLETIREPGVRGVSGLTAGLQASIATDDPHNARKWMRELDRVMKGGEIPESMLPGLCNELAKFDEWDGVPIRAVGRYRSVAQKLDDSPFWRLTALVRGAELVDRLEGVPPEGLLAEIQEARDNVASLSGTPGTEGLLLATDRILRRLDKHKH